jgi:hypothetical protein
VAARASFEDSTPLDERVELLEPVAIVVPAAEAECRDDVETWGMDGPERTTLEGAAVVTVKSSQDSS